jgi:hypothetical protein
MLFILHWLDGTTEEVEGDTIKDAWTKAGLGAGALPALDYYELKPAPVLVKITLDS